MVVMALVLCNTCIGQVGFRNTLNFSPKEYRGDQYLSSPQNWGVIEDEFGRIYVGNTNGVLVFDGLHWQMIAGTEDLWLFKFAKDAQGRIFTGGKGGLGYFDADTTGRLKFVNLIQTLPNEIKDFGRIYSCVSHQGKVYFRSNKYLIEWDGTEFKYWHADGKFLQVLATSHRLFAYQTAGLFSLVNDSLELVSSDSTLNSLRVKGILELDTTNLHNNHLLLVSGKNGIYKVVNNNAKHVVSGLDSVVVFNCSLTTDGHLAVATNGHGVIIVDRDGEIRSRFNEDSRLQGNQAVFPYEDSQQGIWTALFNGVSRISYHNRISKLDKDNGLGSFASAITDHLGELYIGTLNGFYTLTKDRSSVTTLKKGIGVSGAVQDFSKVGNKLYAVTESGIFDIISTKNSNQVLKMEGTVAMVESTNRPGVAYVARNTGAIHRVLIKDNNWEDQGEIANVKHNVHSMEEDDAGNIWAGYDGISRLTFGNNDDVIVTTLDSASGYQQEMGIIEVVKVQDRLVFGSAIGVLEFENETGRLVPSDIFGEALKKGDMAYNLTTTEAGNVWLTTEDHTGILGKQKDGSFKYDSLPLITSGVSDIWSIYEDNEGRVWFGGTEALVCYDPSIEQAYDRSFHTHIHKVTLGEDSVIFHGFYSNGSGIVTNKQPESYVFCHPFRYNDISFQFAAPFFEGMDQTKFSFKLEGRKDSWSAWTNSSSKEYTNLSGGDYTFRVRARNAYGKIGEEAAYSFSIEYPWYLRSWAVVLYFVLGGIMIWAAISVATHRLKKSKLELERIVEQRTSEIRQNMNLLEKQKEEIDAERLKSDNLLLNILPKETAAELKEKGAADTKQFDSVSVMFTDFRNFTKISESLSPDEIVNEINICFSAFDRISDKYGLEKIKTIGDSYMCAGGLPVPNSSHAVDTVLAAIEMQDFIQNRMDEKKAGGKPFFEMRCGIHTGPVVAGVVGVKKFQYDIWGDTVNLASRMESSGEIGRVNISESTYLLVKNKVKCAFRGEVEAKNKGLVKMYFVESSNS